MSRVGALEATQKRALSGGRRSGTIGIGSRLTGYSPKKGVGVGAFDKFSESVRGTPVVSRMLTSTMIEAAQALRDICQEFEKFGQPLGDHHLPAGGYMGEMVVKALMEAKLIEEAQAERGALHKYSPTAAGCKVYAGLKKEDAFSLKATQQASA